MAPGSALRKARAFGGDGLVRRQTITFRVNEHRRLKTRTSQRVVPLWPQLATILRPYLDQRVIERGATLSSPPQTAAW
jgi:integrase